jgi:hypothetical protein
MVKLQKYVTNRRVKLVRRARGGIARVSKLRVNVRWEVRGAPVYD